MRRLLRLLPNRLPSYPEFALTVGVIGRGLWLLAPWDVFRLSPVYAYLDQLPPTENQWGVVWICAGLLALLAVRRGAVRFRATIWAILTFFWWATAAFFFQSSPMVPAFWQFLMLGFAALYNLILVRDARGG